MDFTPGAGIDFDRLAVVIVAAFAAHAFAALFGWLQARLLNGIARGR